MLNNIRRILDSKCASDQKEKRGGMCGKMQQNAIFPTFGFDSAFKMLYTPGVRDMKGFLFFAVMMGSLAMAETYTWNPQGGSTSWGTASNWQLSGGSQATSIPQYPNTNEDTYIIGDGSTVNANGHSVGNLGATLQIGDNVKLSANWAFIFKNISIGSGADFNGVSGDGIKWGTDNKTSTTPNKLTLNSSYTLNNNILSSIGSGSTVDFQTCGHIKITDVSGNRAGIDYLAKKALTLSASVTLTASTDTNAPLKKEIRYLIEGPNIWYRDVDASNTNKVVDYTLSSVSETSGITLTKYDLATSEDAVWMRNGSEVSADDLSAGDYRFVATESDGIGIQYWDNNVPEPTTATLSLLALAGLAARRRRRMA